MYHLLLALFIPIPSLCMSVIPTKPSNVLTWTITQKKFCVLLLWLHKKPIPVHLVPKEIIFEIINYWYSTDSIGSLYNRLSPLFPKIVQETVRDLDSGSEDKISVLDLCDRCIHNFDGLSDIPGIGTVSRIYLNQKEIADTCITYLQAHRKDLPKINCILFENHMPKIRSKVRRALEEMNITIG